MVQKTCQIIDDVEPESTEGKAIREITVAARKVLDEGNYVWEDMKDHVGEAKVVLTRKAEDVSGYVKHHTKEVRQKGEDGWEKLKDAFINW
jgi:hypothetical protein